MKRILYMCVFALVLISCERNQVNRVTYNPYDSSVKGTCVTADVPQWTSVGEFSLSQMLIHMDQYGVPTALSADDQLAAFVGDSCRGVVKVFRDNKDMYRFNLIIHASTTDDVSTMQFTLRYYSTLEKGVYTSQPISYVDGSMLGTQAKGYVPSWK